MAAHGGVAGAPFLSWTPEVELVDTVVHSSTARREPAVWGLDQVFDGAAPARLRDIAEGARHREARAIAAELADAGEANWTNDWFGTVEPARLQELRARLNNSRVLRYAQMADALIQSRRIYAPFVGGGGEVYLANLERETLMKRTFQQRFEAAARADGALPRVMLKLGGYHITRGASPTWVQGLGGFVSEYAVAHGVTATTISMWCGPGGAVYSTPEPVQCDESVAAYWPFLAGYVDRERVTIVDFRIWRLRPGRWEHLSADAQAMIGSYDVLVIVPNGPASPFLPELSARAVQ